MSKTQNRRAQRARPNNLVSVRDAARVTGVPARTIQRWAVEGRITAHRDGPRLWRVSIADVERVNATIKPGRKPGQ